MEHLNPKPSIRLTVNVLLTDEEMIEAAKVIDQAFATVHEQFQFGQI